MPSRAIARQLGVRESTVRYHLQRARDGAVDGRGGKPRVATELAAVIDVWCSEHARDDRPINARDPHDHLVQAHSYRSSYKSVLRYVRDASGSEPVFPARELAQPERQHADHDQQGREGLARGLRRRRGHGHSAPRSASAPLPRLQHQGPQLPPARAREPDELMSQPRFAAPLGGPILRIAELRHRHGRRPKSRGLRPLLPPDFQTRPINQLTSQPWRCAKVRVP
jgi:hypothetical protein